MNHLKALVELNRSLREKPKPTDSLALLKPASCARFAYIRHYRQAHLAAQRFFNTKFEAKK